MYVRNKNSLINCYRYFILKGKFYKHCLSFIYFFYCFLGGAFGLLLAVVSFVLFFSPTFF